MKFAEPFDVSLDYLLGEDAPRCALRWTTNELGTRLAYLDKLSAADRATLFRRLPANSQIRAALDNAG